MTTERTIPRPSAAEHKLARRLGWEKSRLEFLGAVDLVAHFAHHRWNHSDALKAAGLWWGRDLGGLSAAQWIVSAACADKIRAFGAVRGVGVPKQGELLR